MRLQLLRHKSRVPTKHCYYNYFTATTTEPKKNNHIILGIKKIEIIDTIA
jgi:hypothetical protein